MYQREALKIHHVPILVTCFRGVPCRINKNTCFIPAKKKHINTVCTFILLYSVYVPWQSKNISHYITQNMYHLDLYIWTPQKKTTGPVRYHLKPRTPNPIIEGSGQRVRTLHPKMPRREGSTPQQDGLLLGCRRKLVNGE